MRHFPSTLRHPQARRRIYWQSLMVAVLAMPAPLVAQGATVETPRINRNVLTQADLKELHAENVYEAIEAVRSVWLRDRGPTSFTAKATRADSLSGGTPIVYMDDVKLGGVDELKRISIRDVVSVSHLSGPEATARYGVGHAAGVILVQTSSSRAPHSVTVSQPNVSCGPLAGVSVFS
ncbi:MAG: TonB-dependent receptor plug domain-containing protein [bacterium]